MRPGSPAAPFDFAVDDIDLIPSRPKRAPTRASGPGLVQGLGPVLRFPGAVPALVCLGIPVLALLLRLFGGGGLGFGWALLLAVVLAAGCFALMHWQKWPAVRRTLASSGLVAAGHLAVLIAALAFRSGSGGTTGGGGGAAEPGHRAPPADLALVPPDAAGFLSVRVADIWNKKEAAPLRKMADANLMAAMTLKQLKDKAGLTIEDVERAMLVMPTADAHAQPLVLVTTSKSFDGAKLASVFLPGAREKKVGDKSYFTAGASSFGIHVADDHTLLASDPRALEAFLKPPAPKEDGPLTEAIRAAGGQHVLVVGFNPSRFADQVRVQMRPGMEQFQPLLDARSGMLTVDADGDLQVTLQLTFAKNEEAEAGEKAAQQLLNIGRLVMPQAGQQLGQAPFPGDAATQKAATALLKNAGDALQDAKVVRDGLVVQTTLHVRMPDVPAAP